MAGKEYNKDKLSGNYVSGYYIFVWKEKIFVKKKRIPYCFLMVILAVIVLFASGKDVKAASSDAYEAYCPLVRGRISFGYEDQDKIGDESKIKSVKWSISGKDAASLNYDKDSCYAYLTFKKTGTVKITRTVKTSKKTVKTNYVIRIYNKNTWFKIDGYTYYCLKEGGYAADKWIGNRYVNTYGHWDKQFEKTDNGIRFRKKDGSYASAEWITSEDGYEYYFGSDGLMVKNKWIEGYYLQKDGKKKPGLKKTETGWKMADYYNWEEYEDENGETQYKEAYLKDLWQMINGKYVYFDDNGDMVKNQWKKISSNTYYFDKNGYLATSSWIDGYYVDEKGTRVKNKRVGDYYVGKNGKKAVSQWIGGYYVNGSGKILKNRWIDGSYVGLNGKKVKNMKVASGRTAINGSCLYATQNDLKRLVSIAKKELGKPYIWGGNGPDGYDCSGFVSYCYRTLGYTLPRTTYYMDDSGVKIDADDISEWQIGDLLVHKGDINGGSGGHVIMYIGDGKVIQSTRGGVQLGLAQAYLGYYDNIRRILYVK